MCLAQGPQRSDAGEARTRGPSVSSQALYHWATALPKYTQDKNILKTKMIILKTKSRSQWPVKGTQHSFIIHLIISRAADNTTNTSTHKIKSHVINSFCVHHNPEPLKHIVNSLLRFYAR